LVVISRDELLATKRLFDGTPRLWGDQRQSEEIAGLKAWLKRGPEAQQNCSGQTCGTFWSTDLPSDTRWELRSGLWASIGAEFGAGCEKYHFQSLEGGAA
jgi:hypothetical protein